VNPWSFDGMDELFLSDPEHALGFCALSDCLNVFYRWFTKSS
jgi:hypothetical protein